MVPSPFEIPPIKGGALTGAFLKPALNPTSEEGNWHKGVNVEQFNIIPGKGKYLYGRVFYIRGVRPPFYYLGGGGH